MGEVTMRSAIKVSAILLALGGGLGVVMGQYRAAAVDQTVGLGAPQQAAIVDDFDIETTGSINLAGSSRLALTDEQRGLIFLGVINVPDVPDAFLHVPPTGSPLPETVQLHAIPAMVVRRIPELAGYKFAKLEDRILVVSAQTRQVADMIPRYKLVFHN
jgi:hypothetical protein